MTAIFAFPALVTADESTMWACRELDARPPDRAAWFRRPIVSISERQIMHESSPYQHRRPGFAGRPGVIIAIVVVMLCAGAVVAFRYLGKGPDGGVGSAAAASVTHSAASSPGNSG